MFTSLLIAGCAAFFSVYGIGLLFSGATIAAMVMASSLELGKLVTTSWLFRYWNKANILMKTYMIVAIFALMGITSLGVFGFLTAAFQKSSLETELSVNKITTLETQKNEEKLKEHEESLFHEVLSVFYNFKCVKEDDKVKCGYCELEFTLSNATDHVLDCEEILEKYRNNVIFNFKSIIR